jgi:hypothetical protein
LTSSERRANWRSAAESCAQPVAAAASAASNGTASAARKQEVAARARIIERNLRLLEAAGKQVARRYLVFDEVAEDDLVEGLVADELFAKDRAGGGRALPEDGRGAGGRVAS